ncbi:MAG TPA: NAD(P)-binding protein [Pseudonocardiaceae bacterium]|nr:NAD(P)-binding protein [Pseudonocardiaceae bacterium]
MRGYEYVVVGAGTAGCVLAARLSADGVRVLLLEAGGARALESMAIPPAWPTLMGSSADWADQTVPQQVTGTRVAWPRPRVGRVVIDQRDELRARASSQLRRLDHGRCEGLGVR